MKKFFAVVFILLAVVVLVRADYYIKAKAHTDPISMMGQNQPAKDEIHEQWIGGDKFANITPEISIILDLKQGLAWIVQHKTKTYVETTLPLDIAKLIPPEAAAMMGMMKATVSVQPTGEKKTIGQWACVGYNVSVNMMMMPMKMAVWATENVPFDLNLYKSKMFSAMMKGTLRLDDASVAEMEKVKGYWISNETTMEIMGAKMRNTSDVVEISQKAPAADVYKVPAGYTQSKTLAIR